MYFLGLHSRLLILYVPHREFVLVFKIHLVALDFRMSEEKPVEDIQEGKKPDEVSEVKENKEQVWEIHETYVECENPKRCFVFYLKENRYGRFLKMKQTNTEKMNNTHLIMSMTAVLELCQHLFILDRICHSRRNADSRGLISTIRMTDYNKRYFLDLKENDLGKFLDITEMPSRGRIRFPSHCIIEMYKALQKVVIFSMENPQNFRKIQPSE